MAKVAQAVLAFVKNNNLKIEIPNFDIVYISKQGFILKL